ncbi:MAG: response regulator [Elusimicrobiota bacterium]|jgi:two-component system phosphate regulon response regulator PhoB
MKTTLHKRILVIDDDLVVRRLLTAALSPTYDVITLPSGENAGLLFENIEPDLVILDIRLPVISGYDIARSIRRRPSGQNTPLMFLSGHFKEVPLIHEMEATRTCHMAKPFDVSELRHRVATLVQS